MSDSYMIRLEINKSIKSKNNSIEFYKKILSLKEFITDLEFFEYNKEFDSISGSIILDKKMFSSLYETVSNIKSEQNLDFYKGQTKKYALNFSLFIDKKNNSVVMEIEDIAEELYYKHSEDNLRINKFVMKNCEVMIEFVKKLIELYNPETAEVGIYNNTSDSLAPTILEYSKKNGFNIHRKTLFRD